MIQTFKDHWPNYLIEGWGLGTFMVSAGVTASLLYAPTSPVFQWLPNPFLRDVIMGVTMGLTAIAIIYSPWGKRSGAHINPAVTLTFFRLHKIAPWDALFYILFQFLGGWIGVLLVVAIVGNPFTDLPVNHVVTIPGIWGWPAALLAEFTLSFGLMMMVLVTSNRLTLSKWTGIFSGMLVAFYIIVEAPISGMGINPARTFASALPAQEWTGFWIYYLAPPLAMLCAAEIYQRVTGLQSRSICCKLCPNGETSCISANCCGQCQQLVRSWHSSAEPLN